jgi:hypothetical protein
MVMKHSHSRTHRVTFLALCVTAALAGGCKKKKPPTGLEKPDPNSVVCPATDVIVRAVEKDQKDRAVKAACLVFAPGYYWLGAAISYDPKTSADVKVHLVSGGQAQRISDIEPLPAAALADLLKKSDAVQVRIRRGADNRLVRLGVMGHRKGQQPEAEEIGMVLQLVAHAPPKLLWVGAGDQISTADGCHLERTVDFEMPFGNRLEMITTTHARGGTSCASGPASQQQIETKGVALKAGRTLTGL